MTRIVSLFLSIDSVSRIYGLSVWRRMADKFGARPLLMVSATVTSMVPLAFVFVNGQNYFFVPLIFIISAVSYAAVDISIGQVLFKSAPRKYDAYYLSSFTSLTGLMSALGPIIGGLIALIIKNYSSFPFVHIISPLKYVFIISFVLRTMCLPFISRIHEPRAKDVKDILERMKTLRYFSFFVNIYNFAQYTSKIVLIPQKQLFILQRKTVQRARRDLSNLMPVFSRITRSLNKLKVTPYHEKKIGELKEELDKKVEKMDYAREGEIQRIPKLLLSKMESLEISMHSEDKKAVKEKVKSVIKSVENSKEKLDEALLK